MPTNTYVALDKTTVTVATPSITFTGISGAYTDLVIVASNIVASASFPNIQLRFNGDTGANYGATMLEGTGSVARSAGKTSVTLISDGDNVSLGGSNPSTFIYNIMNYSNTTTYKTVLLRGNQTTNGTYAGVSAVAGTWRNTNAITSVTLILGDFAAGATFSLYGIKAEPVSVVKASGGDISFGADGYVYHTFLANGTFTPSQALTCDYFVLAGGGASGAVVGGGWAGGGGGGGGYRTFSSVSFASGTGYAATVGAGGAGRSGSGAYGLSGANSSLIGGAISSTSSGGGGGGTSEQNGNTLTTGQAGGSGGGGPQTGFSSVAGGAGNAGSYSPVEGYAGFTTNASSGAGHGGGAGGVGTMGGYVVPTNGAIAFNGLSYGRGGYVIGTTTDAINGAANTGNGGSSRNDGTGNNYTGGNGGSGIIVVRYLKA